MESSHQPHPLTMSERLQQLAVSASEDELKKEAAHLSAAELSDLISLLAIQAEQGGYDKSAALILGLDDAAKLQSVATSITPYLACHLFSITSEAMQKRLSPLLVGMNFSVFLEALQHANEQQMTAIKREATTEPLQHHLGLLAQELNFNLEASQKELESLYHRIQELPLDGLDIEQLHAIDIEVERLFRKSFVPQKILNKALAVAWNTSRTDLIARLSSLKERYQKFAAHFCEQSESSASNSANLHKAMKDRLNSVYTQDAHDDDAAIDALAHLSIWYIKDYWEIGLLPGIPAIESVLATGNAATPLNGDLFEVARNNLEKTGLKTLKDLKEAHIYSKKSLKDFIKTKQHLIQD